MLVKFGRVCNLPLGLGVDPYVGDYFQNPGLLTLANFDCLANMI